MSWTVAIMKSRIRNLCSMQGTTQISDSQILAYMNRYYSWDLVKDIRPIQLHTWYNLTLTVGVDTYDLKKTFYDTYIKVDPIAYISTTASWKEHQLQVYYNLEEFYSIWTESLDYTDTANQGQPSSVLLYNNELLFRKCPDDTYYASIKAMRKPYVYVSGGSTTATTFVNDADIPELEAWGQLIVYGASKAILQELGDLNSFQMMQQLYQSESDDVGSLSLNWYDQTRAIPKF